MHIVYTINGEGMGHALRSSVVIDHLLACNHEVTIFSSGKAVRFLEKRFGSVAEIMGLHMVYKDNRVQRRRTAARVLRHAPEVRNDLKTIRETLSGKKPDAVITDFDFHGQLVSRFYSVPLISIDNIQYVIHAKCLIAPEDFVDYELHRVVARMMVPYADHYFVTAFDKPTLKKPSKAKKVTFIPPLLRENILNAETSLGEHILVYQTTDSYDDLLSILGSTDQSYIVYNTKKTERYQNITCKSFSEKNFIADMATAKAVITNGGFNVITESLYLKKPLLCVPITNFFEQKLNAQLVDSLGSGKMVSRLSTEVLTEFIDSIEQYRVNLKNVSFDTKTFFKKFDSLLEHLAKARDTR